MPNRGIDRCFLHYGIRQEDMNLIEQECQANDIDAEWLKEEILKPYNEERNKENTIEDKKLKGIINKALRQIQ
ncbi:MAG: hypothetical protein MJZ97_12465 [Bacteroidales bacterium]|nr:hypothetical protein [Bacteroidales bacterium]